MPQRSLATFGMAGVIHTRQDVQALAADERWLECAFAATRATTRREYRNDRMLVVSCLHAGEIADTAGTTRYPVPTSGAVQGVVHGHFFGNSQTCAALAPSRSAVAGWADQGKIALRNLNGAWAAALWHAGERRAYFARDPLGVLPLHVLPRDGRILFATDLRLLEAAGVGCDVDEQGLAEFLHYLYVPAPRTLLDGCRSVLPGHVLSLGDEPRQEKFAAPRFVRGGAIAPEAIDAELQRQLPAFEDRLLTAAADCIPPQGRIALMLSGGKDSATLAVAFSKLCPDRVLAVNVGSRDARADESSDAALVCRALGLQFQSYTPTDDDLARGVYQFAAVQDQPVGDLAALPYFLCMARLPDDCSVIIDGTGDDYYFGIPSIVKGAQLYRRRARLQRLVPSPLWPALVQLLAAGPPAWRQLGRRWSRPIEETFVAWEGWSASELSALLRRPVSFEHTHLWNVMRGGDDERWIELLTDVVCSVWEPHAAYRKAVHFAHATGHGIRFPFIDGRLARFINELPEGLKFRDGVNKQILRAFMAKHLPSEILHKPKAPFVFDVNRVLRNPLHGWLDDLDAAGLLQLRRRWSDEPIKTVVSQYREAPGDARWQHRVYALCLSATVLAMKSGYEPRIPTPQ